MLSSVGLTVKHAIFPSARQCWRVLLVLALTGALWGCSSFSNQNLSIAELAPLQLGDRSLSPAEVTLPVPAPALLATDEAMREFVTRYTGNLANAYQRLMSLHQAVGGAGGLDIQYDPFAEGSAREVFHRGSANCLSYANLFVALAREAGLDARYQWLEVRPQWSRVNERVLVGLHVNVTVRLGDGRRFMVDIDPLPSREVAGALELSDSDAEALYYNNIAMDALANDDPEQAWAYLVHALRLSPEMAHLWVNLGAIYRYTGQYREAERNYLHALDLDHFEHSAMSNLAVLYGLEGRAQDRDYWQGRVDRHRQSNPYYHAWLGDEAAAGNDWAAALRSYHRAIELAPQDDRLVFSRGLIYYQLENFDAAALDINKAIELATLRSDIENYQMQLEEVRRARLAGF
jgi:Flp pilus assembly protein TadD